MMSEQAASQDYLIKAPIYYVGIGASAGGLEALESFFVNLPPDTGMAFVVIQHLSPDYKSMMVELLSKRTMMPVRRAEEGMLVEANTVYLIPPKHNLSIFHGKLLLSEQESMRGINLPIDFFFRSLADDQADKAVGIILSGTGSDGVRGVRAIKEAGGMVMVQSEDSARFDGMPRSAISTGVADFVLPPSEMPKKLISFARHLYTAKPENPQALLSDEDGMVRIFSLLRERTKVDFTHYKPSTILRRIERRMAFNQFTNLRDYVRFFENHAGEVASLYRDLLIGVTSFFRDHEVFDDLLENYLPDLFKRANRREIRFWIGGCSTGEEAYTLAMISRDLMEQMGIKLDLKIFATDVDRDAILKAGSGIYPESITADVPAKYLTKYFLLKDDQYHIDRGIREMVVFAQHNIIKDPPFTNIELMSCRNLLIYLQPVLQKKVMELINFSLNPQGLLVLGTSETIGDMGDYFETLSSKNKIYLSKGKRHPPVEVRDFPSSTDVSQWSQRRFRGIGAGTRQHEEERLYDRLLQLLAGNYVPLTVVVNENLEVQHILGNSEGYLKLPSGKLMNDISRMAVKELAIPISTGLQKVFKTGEELRYTNIRVDNNIVHLRLVLLPGKKLQEPLAAIFIEEDQIKTSIPDQSHVSEYDLSQEAEQRIRDLEQEIQFIRENLQATIEELETSNEELQATNEELLASNEELQSTNEELQSVNEELHTVNAEYQRKIIELTELNNDLDNLMTSTQVGTVFLDENLEIRRFTPDSKTVLHIVESDIGRPIHHITHTLLNVDLYSLIVEVEKTNLGKELQVQAQSGCWYLLRILPYFISARSFSGVVVSFIDITNLKKAEDAWRASERKMEGLYRTVPVGIGLSQHRRIIDANKRLGEMLGYRLEQMIGKALYDLFQSENELDRVEKEIREQIKQHGISTIETHWKHYDGSIIPILMTCTPLNGFDHEETIVFTVMDLTLRNQAQARAQENEERYRLLFDTMEEGVVYQNRAGAIISLNPAALRILGLTEDEAMGRTSYDPQWHAIKPDGSPYPGEEHPSMRAIQKGEPMRGEIMGIHNPHLNQTRWIRINAIPLFDGKSKDAHLVYTTFTDISDMWTKIQEKQA